MYPGPALALAVALAQAPQRDTLVYNLALVPAGRSVSVEARHTNLAGGALSLSAPPAAARAGAIIAGIGATDDRGAPVSLQRDGSSYRIEPRGPGAIRFRYRINFRDRVADGSTSAGFDGTRLYAVTAALFVAPDPTAALKTRDQYPVLRVRVLTPDGWRVVTGFARQGAVFAPQDGEELLGATLAAAPDFRVYSDTVGRTALTVAVRGRRYFSDSALREVIAASLRGGARALGPVPAERVTYTSDHGRKGRTSGSLHGSGSIGLIWEPGELLERARAHDTFHETLHLWFGGAMSGERWWTEGVTDYFAARLYAAWKDDPGELAALCYESFFNYSDIEHNIRLTMAQEARQRMGGDNTELLVYRKGMLAGLMLDAAIREATADRATLDDVARRLLERARARRSRVVREPEIRAVVGEVGGEPATRVWDRVVTGTARLDVREISDALQRVTGRSFAVPFRPKQRKQLLPANGGAP